MSSNDERPPDAPDPERILQLQNQYNRYGQSNPFGSQQWTEGEDGRQTLNTTASPQMQGAIDRAFAASATPYQKQYIPQGMDQLSSAILGKVGKRYGLEGDALNTNMKQQQQPAPQPNMQALQHSMQGSPQMGGMPQMGSMQQVLQALQGGMGGQQPPAPRPQFGQLQHGSTPRVGNMGG